MHCAWEIQAGGVFGNDSGEEREGMRFSCLLLFVFSFCTTAPAATSDNAGAVHEWGTFTSVAGADGSATRWLPLSGPADLPCFVHRLDQRNVKLAFGRVRMETPVLYFYPLRPMSVSVHVDFPKGRVTEWYPQATSVQPLSSPKGWIEWKDVQVNHSGALLPKESTASRYYAARETTAWPVSTGGENEKLLFYRGIGDFDVDLKPLVQSDGMVIHNDGPEAIPTAIVFENHEGKIGYRILHRLSTPVTVPFSELNGGMDALRKEMEQELVEMGLYQSEASAMLETWRDSWFEKGLRVIYILPRSTADALLPISIQPSPSQLSRVFVGRVEVLSPWMREEISRALRSGDIDVLKSYGRFLNAFLQEMGGRSEEPPMCDRARQFLRSSYASLEEESLKPACTQ